ncbi:hypothetical protein ACTPOK_12435 [Streptomyces inhibens]|uniref:hypothetical protein n=1 Tax=Streptomyces inhibens TaxID=2293571 RepID=UPI00402A90FF
MPEGSVTLDIPEELPIVAVDPGLLERSVANLVENAVKYSPDGESVLVAASALGDRVSCGSPTAARRAGQRQGPYLRALPALR